MLTKIIFITIIALLAVGIASCGTIGELILDEKCVDHKLQIVDCNAYEANNHE